MDQSAIADTDPAPDLQGRLLGVDDGIPTNQGFWTDHDIPRDNSPWEHTSRLMDPRAFSVELIDVHQISAPQNQW